MTCGIGVLKHCLSNRFPTLYGAAKRFWHHCRHTLERHILGSRLQEWLWRHRHWFDADMSGFDRTSLHHEHREQILAAVSGYASATSILEIGFGYGANLIRIRNAHPSISVYGMDINSTAVEATKRYFSENGLGRVQLYVGGADHLHFLADREIDLVLSDAVLMFVGPDKIKDTLAEFVRVARQGIILNEFHLDGATDSRYEGGRWVHDYRALFSTLAPRAAITLSKSTYVGPSWSRFGTLIEARL